MTVLWRVAVRFAYLVIWHAAILVSVKKHSSGYEDKWEYWFSKHRIRGWRAVSAEGLQGKGSPGRNVLFTVTDIDIPDSLREDWTNYS